MDNPIVPPKNDEPNPAANDQTSILGEIKASVTESFSD